MGSVEYWNIFFNKHSQVVCHFNVCFSRFMVLANDLFVLYLSYTMEIMLDKKQIQDIFLFEFQMGHKAAEELAASKHICFRSNGGGENQEVLQSVRTFIIRNSVPTLHIYSDQVRSTVKSDPFTVIEEVAKELRG